MMELVEKVVARLIDLGLTITFAETCTGGLMASKLISVPNASKVLNASVIVYSNESKVRYTGISKDVLIHYGAVSEEAVKAMAEGIALANHADIGVAISGITGPKGGTDEKPVGMVCFGFYINGHVEALTHCFGDIGRIQIRDESVRFAYEVLFDRIK